MVAHTVSTCLSHSCVWGEDSGFGSNDGESKCIYTYNYKAERWVLVLWPCGLWPVACGWVRGSFRVRCFQFGSLKNELKSKEKIFHKIRYNSGMNHDREREREVVGQVSRTRWVWEESDALFCRRGQITEQIKCAYLTCCAFSFLC